MRGDADQRMTFWVWSLTLTTQPETIGSGVVNDAPDEYACVMSCLTVRIRLCSRPSRDHVVFRRSRQRAILLLIICCRSCVSIFQRSMKSFPVYRNRKSKNSIFFAKMHAVNLKKRAVESRECRGNVEGVSREYRENVECVVVPPGIEPGSKVQETRILSIELWNHYFLSPVWKFSVFFKRVVQKVIHRFRGTRHFQ